MRVPLWLRRGHFRGASDPTRRRCGPRVAEALGAVPYLTGVDPQAVLARRPADETRREPVVREPHVSPRRDLGLLDRRRGRRVRQHGGGHRRGDEIIATEQRDRAVIVAPAQERHLQGRRFPQRNTDRWRLDRRAHETTREATIRGVRRAIEPPSDDDPVVHAVGLPRCRAAIANYILAVVRRVSSNNPHGAGEQLDTDGRRDGPGLACVRVATVLAAFASTALGGLVRATATGLRMIPSLRCRRRTPKPRPALPASSSRSHSFQSTRSSNSSSVQGTLAANQHTSSDDAFVVEVHPAGARRNRAAARTRGGREHDRCGDRLPRVRRTARPHRQRCSPIGAAPASGSA